MRLSIEKFISHHQGVAYTNRLRQEELLDRTIMDMAARAAAPSQEDGVTVMCPSELEVLDSMLSRYRELSLRVIQQQHQMGSPRAEDRRAAESMKLEVEKFIGLHKTHARCTREISSGKKGSEMSFTASEFSM